MERVDGLGGKVETEGRGREKKRNVPDTAHDQHAGDGNGAIARDLAQPLPRIEVAVSTRVRAADGLVQDQHAEQGDAQAEDALPAHDLQRLQRVLLQDVFFQHELGGGEDLRAGDQQDADDGLQRFGRLGCGRGVLGGGAEEVECGVGVRLCLRIGGQGAG